eukprot:4195849-Amphidinium_carterae.1
MVCSFHPSGGQMLQIFIAKSVVDQWAYHSHPLGRPFETKSSVQDWLAGERGAPAINGQAKALKKWNAPPPFPNQGSTPTPPQSQ